MSQSHDPSRQADVCILGYGPVGAGAAVLLARAGLKVLVLERSRQVYDLPRAVLLDGETVRAFQRVGLGQEIASVLQPWREGDAAWFTDSARQQRFGIDFEPVGSNGWRDGAFFDQPELEQRLREIASREPNIQVRDGSEVTGFEQDDHGVTTHYTDLASGESASCRTSWMVACDGASSFARRHLGIAWNSLGYDCDWLVVDVVMKDVADLPPVTMQVCSPERLTTYICGRDPFRRWEFRMLPGETRDEMLSPGRVRALIDPWVAADRYTLRRTAVYQFHAAVAARWSVGRVFLAGDAAHQTPPFLGQGVNAGFRDVVNLSWKLALVHEGAAPRSLLDTYERERSPHAEELVAWAVAAGRLMEALADLEAGRLQGELPDELMRSGYGQGRTAPPLREGIVATEQVSDGGFTGYVFAQPFVRDASGREGMLDEWLGSGFAVVGRDAGSLAMSEHSLAVLERLGARVVDLSGLTVTRGAFDRLYAQHGAAIVRPDRYLFGVADADQSLDDLVARLDRLWSGRPA